MSVSELPGEVAAEQFLSGKFNKVDVVGIERELRQLWQTASAAEIDLGHPTVSRACALNLVLYTADENAEQTAGDLLDEIALTHPCRALLAIARPDETPDLEAWVSARCHLPAPGATRQICCEQITVRWEGEGVYQLPSVVLPLLVPDLPVFLWWRTDSFPLDTVTPFLAAVDRLVFDSRRWGEQATAFRDVASLSRNHRGRLAVSDLAWRRIHPWREAIASAFDCFVMAFGPSDLEMLSEMEIEHGAGSSTEALLLIAWMAERLGLQPDKEGAAGGSAMTTRHLFSSGKGLLAATVTRRPTAEGSEASLKSVRLVLGTKELDLNIERVEGKPVLSIRARQDGNIEKEVIAKAPETLESRLLGHELDVLGHDRVFEATLQVVAQMVPDAKSGEG